MPTHPAGRIWVGRVSVCRRITESNEERTFLQREPAWIELTVWELLRVAISRLFPLYIHLVSGKRGRGVIGALLAPRRR